MPWALPQHDSYHQTGLKRFNIEIFLRVLLGRFLRYVFHLTLDQMAELFDRNKSTISRHIKNIFESGELNADSTVAFFATTAADGKTYNEFGYVKPSRPSATPGLRLDYFEVKKHFCNYKRLINKYFYHIFCSEVKYGDIITKNSNG